MRLFLISCLLFFICACALAQVEEQVAPAELKQKTIVTEPTTLYKGFFRATLAGSYSYVDKIFDENSKRFSVASNGWATIAFLDWTAYYGISDRLQVAIHLPLEFNQQYQSLLVEFPDDDFTQVNKWHNESSGFGDPGALAAYQFVTDGPTRPSITGYLEAHFPLAEKNPTEIKNDREFKTPLGQGEAPVTTDVRLRKVNYPYSYFVDASFTYFTGGRKLLSPLDTEEKPFRSGSNFSLSGSFNFHINDWIAIRNFADFFYSVKDEYDGVKEPFDQWVIRYYPGVSFQIGRFRIDEVVIVPLAGKFASADPNYIVLLQYIL